MNKNKIYSILVLGLLLMFGFAGTLYAQQGGATITATVTDGQGNPLNGATIRAPKGAIALTDERGKFTMDIKGNSSIIVEKDGYDTQVIYTSKITDEIQLVESEIMASEKDVIKTGFSTTTRREITGAVSTITPQDRITYDNTQYVKSYIEGLMLGVKGNDNIRGLGDALFVIDGIIGRNPDILSMEEVEQITVLKDANAIALYGNQARNGVIIINTKRGKINSREARVNVNFGVKEPKALPNYLGAVDYMELYNEARANDGSDPYYGQSLIDEYKTSTNPYKYPDVDYYSDEYLRERAFTANVNTEFSGGNDRTQYYINMGWKHSQDLVQVNPDVNKAENRFNVRGNIDFKISDYVKSSVDVVAIISGDRNSRENILDFGTTVKPNDYAPLLPASMVDTENNEELLGQMEAARIYDGMLLGTSKVAKEDAPFANIIAGGYQTDMFRLTQFNNAIDFDLSMLTEGLSAKTYLSFDFYDAYNVTIKNKYKTYAPNDPNDSGASGWVGDKIIGLADFGPPDQIDQTENVATDLFVSRMGFYALLNYKKQIKEDHFINTTLLGYMDSEKREGVKQPNNNAHLGFQFTYTYKNKLYADLNTNYANSIKLPEGNRGGFSPTAGLSYIISEEDFMAGADWMDYLKLKATYGVLKSDYSIDKFYLYKESYTDGTWFNWNDGWSNREKDITQGENMLMVFDERVDLNLGFESNMFNSLWLEFNYFNTSFDKLLTTLDNTYPSFYDVFKPYNNYDKNNYEGFELGLNYHKTFNDFSLNIGGNILYSQSEIVKRDEANEYEYQAKIGTPVNTIWGLEDNGFYSEDDFTTDADGNYILNEGMAVPSYGAVQPGDIKYFDQNGDDIIDDNDRKNIGQSSNPWSYGTDLKLSYKGFTFYVLGVGQFGGESNLSDDYYWVDGDDKYSEVVLGRWTPETAGTATFPRLSTGENQNNFRRSTFWMYNNSFFQVKRMQLTYEFDKSLCQKLGMSNMSINIAGSNLWQVAENKDYRELRIGGNPLYSYYTIGLRTTF